MLDIRSLVQIIWLSSLSVNDLCVCVIMYVCARVVSCSNGERKSNNLAALASSIADDESFGDLYVSIHQSFNGFIFCFIILDPATIDNS